MTASEKSFLGLAEQTAQGTPNTTDAEFNYILYTQGGGAVNNVFRKDKVQEGLNREQVLSNAPSANDQQFMVPKIIE